MAEKIVEVYHDPETDEYTVSCDGFDDFSTFCEQEAMDEAEVMAFEIGGKIRRTYWLYASNGMEE